MITKELVYAALECIENGDKAQAEALLSQASSISSNDAFLTYAKGLNEFINGEKAEAKNFFVDAIVGGFTSLDAFYYLAVCQSELIEHQEACATIEQGLSLNSTQQLRSEWLPSIGGIFHEAQRYKDALTYLQLCAPESRGPHTLNVMGSAYAKLGDPVAAASCYKDALMLEPKNAELHKNYAAVQLQLRNLSAVVKHLEIAGNLNEAYYDPIALALFSGSILDFNRQEKFAVDALQVAAKDQSNRQPYGLIMLTDSARIVFKGNQGYSARFDQTRFRPQKRRSASKHKIRLGYLSSDYKTHATTHLISELIGKHDRTKFEIVAVDYTSASPDDPDRINILKKFDRVIDIQNDSDETAANRIKHSQIDILIDLKGYTEGARPNILSYETAPIRVSYLGYPCTTGNSNYDYIIGDTIVSPLAAQQYFSETIVQLSCSYQPNNPSRAVGPPTTREENGLPLDTFVFCCFNHHWKYNRKQISIWANILDQCADSVLWLLQPLSDADLAQALAAMGIPKSRLVVAPRQSIDKHLERVSHANLFLDTFPCGAHTTASDSIYRGVPVLTRLGEAFHSRVSASLMHHAGCSEFIAESDDEYIAKAIRYYDSPQDLKTVATRLLDFTKPGHPYNLIDTTVALENAFHGMMTNPE